MIFLCFGNSLTAGWPGYYPPSDGISRGNGNFQSQYEYWLKRYCVEYIEKKLNKEKVSISKEIIFVNKGIPGDTSTGLLYRINDLIAYNPKPNYSIIIIGTNDLGWSSSTQKILKNIMDLHRISKDNKIFSIGGLIPPITKRASSQRYDIIQSDFNEELKDFFIKNNIPFTDYSYMKDEENYLKPEFTTGDGIHFSVEGYKHMGLSLFENVIKHIIDKEINEFR